jgi:hypothetical protein
MKVGDVLWGTWVVFFILLFYEMGMDILNSIYNFIFFILVFIILC